MAGLNVARKLRNKLRQVPNPTPIKDKRLVGIVALGEHDDNGVSETAGTLPLVLSPRTA